MLDQMNLTAEPKRTKFVKNWIEAYRNKDKPQPVVKKRGPGKAGIKDGTSPDVVPANIGVVMGMRENMVNALNYNCDFKRLTQLFGRALQIKYYQSKKPEQLNKRIDMNGREIDPLQSSQESKRSIHFMNEEGDMLEGCDAEDLDAGNNAA